MSKARDPGLHRTVVLGSEAEKLLHGSKSSKTAMMNTLLHEGVAGFVETGLVSA